jgi:hypothetical protein
MNTIFGFQQATTDNLLAGSPADVDWIWEGYLARGATTLLTSQWKAALKQARKATGPCDPKQAPKGPRIVATGEATALRSPSSRNPWTGSGLFPTRPSGAKDGRRPGILATQRHRIGLELIAQPIPLPLRGRIEDRPIVSTGSRSVRLAANSALTRRYTPSPRRGANRKRIRTNCQFRGALIQDSGTSARLLAAGCR